MERERQREREPTKRYTTLMMTINQNAQVFGLKDSKTN